MGGHGIGGQPDLDWAVFRQILSVLLSLGLAKGIEEAVKRDEIVLVLAPLHGLLKKRGSKRPSGIEAHNLGTSGLGLRDSREGTLCPFQVEEL